ncbi:MAG TPA: adenylyl-sulfate kinase [Actinomycetota bacterium]|nr:adenylyl-sulfate kinase [Actinomycetota bacterium]
MTDTSAWITTTKHFGPAPAEGGFTVWFTGLSGSGKSTLAELLVDVLERRGRRYELLDGDVVRTNLSKGLGFSKEDRDTNILRIGWVAERLAYHGAAVLVSAISPYREIRDKVRERIPRFVEVFVSCPVEVCAQRDVKGLYEKAFRGEITGFTGVDDPYEPPEHPEVVVETDRMPPEECLAVIVARLEELGYLPPEPA